MLTSIVLAALSLGTPRQTSPASAAQAIIDTALARMGGRDAVQRVQRVRREMLTSWQRINFRNEPYADAPVPELHADIRDYSRNAWRNTRKSSPLPGSPQIVDIVVDSVAIRQGNNGVWAPLSIAYVDERREVFATAPEHLLLVARDAPDLALRADTVIDGTAAARVTATVDGFRMTLVFRRGDGLLAMTRFRVDDSNDFGLSPWGPMELETWYSRWTRTAAGVALPFQLDQKRVGKPYKRMTVLAAAFDTVTPPESFAISDSLRTAYFATATRPMYDVPVDTAKIVDGSFAIFGAFGSPVGAVKVGGRWVLIEAGQGEVSATRAVDWLHQHDAEAPVGAAVLTYQASTNGGATALARARIPAYAAPGSEPFLRRIVRNTGIAGVGPTTVTRDQWVKIGSDSLWLEPIDLPDAPRSLLVYSPTLQWAYSATAATPFQTRYLLSALRARGWSVTRTGSARGLSVPVLQ